jgi:hypothetical protein
VAIRTKKEELAKALVKIQVQEMFENQIKDTELQPQLIETGRGFMR